tara:strand:+ start:750 stop:1013 length:264 start_codon:yes stop_codon:yes gene_type:complete
MIKKILLLSILIFIFIFLYFVVNIYLSEINKVKIKKNRVNIDSIIIKNNSNLIILKNDTNNVIEYNSGYNNNDINKSKRKFWELIKK